MNSECFSAPERHATGDTVFDILIASTGAVVPVAPDQAVVQPLVACRVWVPTSCEQGVCGTCLTRVLSGDPDHRAHHPTPTEQVAKGQFLRCCSRSHSPLLVLDL